MGTRVSIREVLGEIAESNRTAIDAQLRQGKLTAPYSYRRFVSDMGRRDLLVDARPVRARWDVLLGLEVVAETGSWANGDVKAVLLIPSLRDYLGKAQVEAVDRIAEARRYGTDTHTQTHIQTPTYTVETSWRSQRWPTTSTPSSSPRPPPTRRSPRSSRPPSPSPSSPARSTTA